MKVLKKEKRKGHVWARIRLFLTEYLGLLGRFIARVITMVWLRYLYLIGPRIKRRINLNEFHSLLSTEPKIDGFIFLYLSSLDRLLGKHTSYEKLISWLRSYTHDQDEPEFANKVKTHANFLVCLVSFIFALFPFNVPYPARHLKIKSTKKSALRI